MRMREIEEIVKDQIIDISRKIRVDFGLHEILALIYTESCGNEHADSGFARGLMQVSRVAFEDVKENLPDLLAGIDYEDISIPVLNVRTGIAYLQLLYTRLKRLVHPPYAKLWSVIAYNWGLKNVIDLLQVWPCEKNIFELIPEETQRHLWRYLTILTYLETH